MHYFSQQDRLDIVLNRLIALKWSKQEVVDALDEFAFASKKVRGHFLWIIDKILVLAKLGLVQSPLMHYLWRNQEPGTM